jgi:class 3 adenylate cyclase
VAPVSEAPPTQGWLQQPDGERIPVRGNLSFGRTADNQLVLPDARVSRRHAILHSQGEGEYWLVDLGSRNGTYVNDRRVHQPVRLRHGDVVRIGPFSLNFGEPGGASPTPTPDPTTLHTRVDILAVQCWLLVADVEGSTRLAQGIPAEKLAVLMGQWFLHCKEFVEAGGGAMNKYLGDGFLAFWQGRATNPAAVAEVIVALQRLQQPGRLPFRFAVHQGEVFLGGAASMGEESLSGPAVNFVFRMEKLAGTLGQKCLLSAAAAQQLAGVLAPQPLGPQPIAGFEGQFPFFTLAPGL